MYKNVFDSRLISIDKYGIPPRLGSCSFSTLFTRPMKVQIRIVRHRDIFTEYVIQCALSDETILNAKFDV